MKIGIISNLYPPFQRGGAEYVVVRTVEALLDMGHDVFVITGRPKVVPDVSTYTSAQERIYRFVPKNIYFILDDHRYWWPVRLLWHVIDSICTCGKNHVANILDQEKPDVVITHNLKGIGLRIPQAIGARHIPHLHVAHDLQLIYPSGLLLFGEEAIPFYTRPFYVLYQRICRWAFGKPDVVLFPSIYLKNMYERYGFFTDAECLLMPNPTPTFELPFKEERSPGALRLLFVGQLELHKGIRILFDVLRELDIDVSLIIAGEGTELTYVKGKAKENPRVTYLGYVSTEQLINCFGIADALIVPSLCYENSPTVIYEALQAGIPVLAANIGGVGELVQNGKNGFLFKPGDKNDMRGAIKQMNDQKERFAKIHADIRKTVSPYAIECYASRLVEILEKVSQKG